jgi:hypothetical protein
MTSPKSNLWNNVECLLLGNFKMGGGESALANILFFYRLCIHWLNEFENDFLNMNAL